MLKSKATKSGRKREYMEMIDIYFSELKNIPRVTKEEYGCLILKIKNGSEEEKENAKKRLIESHLLYAIKFAKKFEKFAELSELIGVANYALCEGARNYNGASPFHMFITDYLRREISRFITKQNAVSISYSGDVLKRNIERAKASIEADGRKATDDEICKKLNISKLRLSNAKKRSIFSESLEEEIDTDGEQKMLKIDLIPTEELNIAETLTIKDMMKTLLLSFDCLTIREQTILSLHFGLFDNEQYTLDKIGKQLRLTKQAVRQIEQKALAKLKNQMLL